jgi:hypothetical protein
LAFNYFVDGEALPKFAKEKNTNLEWERDKKKWNDVQKRNNTQKVEMYK